MILCDIGNSTFHFLLGEEHKKIGINDDLSSICSNETIYFISVNKRASKILLNQFPNAIDIADMFLIDSQYSDELGVDRRVCSYKQTNAIVVDFGSAITVDIIKDKKHLGGYILPGIDAMKSIYPNISPKLAFNFDNNLNLDKIPTNTNEAISNAIVNMIILPIKNTQEKYNLELIFTGENSKYIRHHCKNSKYEPNMIFNSMKDAVGENT